MNDPGDNPVSQRPSLPPDRARRMRRAATGLLLAMAALFALARSQLGTHPAWEWVLAFTEAAMVGGLADWFAVTALFRHPLGLPIPHTAIIPENKDRIADSMARFLQSNFLIPTVVARRMRAMNLARALGDFLARPEGGEASRIRGGAGEQVAGISQGYKLSGAIWGTELKLKNGTFKHGGQDLMTWVVGNAKVEQRGNAVLITKQAAGKAKIDPLMAGFNAVMLMSRNPDPKRQPTYQLLFV